MRTQFVTPLNRKHRWMNPLSRSTLMLVPALLWPVCGSAEESLRRHALVVVGIPGDQEHRERFLDTTATSRSWLLPTDSRVPLRLRVTPGGAALERRADAGEEDQQWVEVTSWEAVKADAQAGSADANNTAAHDSKPSPNSAEPSLGASDAYHPGALFVHVCKSAFRVDQLSATSESPNRVEPVFALAKSDDARLAKSIAWRGGHVHIITEDGQREVHSSSQLKKDPWLIGVTWRSRKNQ